MSPIMSKLLYISVILFSISFASYSQVNDSIGKKTIRKIPFFLSFAIPWFVIAFTKIGVDYENYAYLIRIISPSNYLIESSETLFNLIVLFLKTYISENPDVVIFILKTITLLLVYRAIYSLRTQVSIGFSVAAYMLLCYLPSFYLITIMLACAIVLNAIAIYYKSHKLIIPIGLVILAGLIHNSALVFLPVFIVLIYLNTQGRLTGLKKWIVLAAYAIAVLGSSWIFNYVSSFAGFHYGNYASNAFNGSGVMIIIIYLPLMYVVHLYVTSDLETMKKNGIFVFALTSLVFNILSYRFRVIERMEFLLIPLYMIYFAGAYRSSKIRTNYAMLTFSKKELLLLLYLLFRGVLVFTSRVTISSGLDQYLFFNPFIL